MQGWKAGQIATRLLSAVTVAGATTKTLASSVLAHGHRFDRVDVYEFSTAVTPRQGAITGARLHGFVKSKPM